MRVGLVAAAVLALLIAWLGRYEVATAGSGSAPAAFVLDRWTGAVRVVIGRNIRDAIEDPPPNPYDKYDKPTAEKPWDKDWGKAPATP